MKSLSNHFLLSMPNMVDSIFSKSLIYICQHDDKGAMGIIINKNMNVDNESEILKKAGLVNINPKPKIYFGGPVNIEMGLFLHDTSYDIEGTIQISKSVSLTSNKKIILDLQHGTGPSAFRFSIGYAGWGMGQIEKEIENGDWLLIPSDDDFIFSISNSDKWEKAANYYGIKISDLSGSPGFS